MSDHFADEDAAFEHLMAFREGRRNDVYEDSRGYLTVGIGHLIEPGDGLAKGDVISDDRVNALFAADSAIAMVAARAQAVEARIADSNFIPYLASVCFQLGPNWKAHFPQTWKAIVAGRYEDAANMLDGTLWNVQTPLRVVDFKGALARLQSLKDARYA